MNERLVEMATQITIKAMGAEASAANWVGNPEDICKFFTQIAATIKNVAQGVK
jgi:hypothetical protein